MAQAVLGFKRPRQRQLSLVPFDVLPDVLSAVVRVSALVLGTRAGCICRFGERCRDLVPDRVVWAMLVVVSTPSLHLFGRVFKVHEPVAVCRTLPKAAIPIRIASNEGDEKFNRA